MPTLEKLQHLLFLQLWDSYKGRQMVCSTKGFPKLQHLKISVFNQLEEWVVEEGAMPCLLTCEITCSNLKMGQGRRRRLGYNQTNSFFHSKIVSLRDEEEEEKGEESN
ncbi:Disease resistance protein (CC-NBS-LRR class) family [Thalictrum thalictroides]|uniref:Disease resistance protein (CC-NBS-LRR class) family n=1 Tax=Thalictrum thalictroides TaxID=46969 RepID=A0A7J6WTE9_THATH|nr:Disease resistance protein (CC-NBS-LRR class) family [Thalictrum thalictroides]